MEINLDDLDVEFFNRPTVKNSAVLDGMYISDTLRVDFTDGLIICGCVSPDDPHVLLYTVYADQDALNECDGEEGHWLDATDESDVASCVDHILDDVSEK